MGYVNDKPQPLGWGVMLGPTVHWRNRTSASVADRI